MELETKAQELCKVCLKNKKTECAHVDCPNRKRVTAGVGDGSSLIRGGSNFRKYPTSGNGG